MDKSNLTEAAILFSASIGCFVLAYLHFKGKLSVRWRSGYFYAPKEEQRQSDFKLNSKVRAFTVFLGGIAGILLGFYLLFYEKWMVVTTTIAGLAIVLSIIIASLLSRNKLKRRSQKYPSILKKPLKKEESINLEFSITEIRIALLRFPIIFGCYVLLPLGVLGEIFYAVTQIPSVRFDSNIIETLYYTSFFIAPPCCWILNKVLPKMKFNYNNGFFTKERNSKIETFPATAVSDVKVENIVMPDWILFYLHNQKRPIKISMKGFKTDDRFDIPQKIIHITRMRLTQKEKKILDDFE